MTAVNYLARLKLRQLKNAAFWLGLPTTGTKTELQSILARCVNEPPAPSAFNRILSIDMGIRNLGICVLETPQGPAPSKSSVRERQPSRLPLTVSAWEKVDVLSQLKTKPTPGLSESHSDQVSSKDLHQTRRRLKTKSPVPGDFTPENLAEAAYSLVSSLLTRHQPTCILIERQRFRSGGAFAVQEWTIRVNLLEHMIWACLETLRAQTRHDASADSDSLMAAVKALEGIHAVSPAKVAKFWCSGEPQELGPEPTGWDTGVTSSRSVMKISKADKVAVAQGWVDQWKAGREDERIKAQVDFAGSAVETANVFQSASAKRKTRKRKGDDQDDVKESIGKLDDLADCLLQGVAWVKWGENRRRLAEMVEVGKV